MQFNKTRDEIIDNLSYGQVKQLHRLLTTIKREMWRDLLQGGDGMEGDRIISRLIDQIDEELNHDESE